MWMNHDEPMNLYIIYYFMICYIKIISVLCQMLFGQLAC